MRQNLLCRLLVVSAIAITIFGRAANAAEKYPLRDAEECHRRAGLANFQAKLEAGKDVKIAYLGGSITAAPGWRVLSRQWFQQQYPKVKVPTPAQNRHHEQVQNRAPAHDHQGQ